MGLFSKLKQLISPQPLIGVTDPVCPYCECSLAKMPGRKKKCPGCGDYIYVRTRPQDRVRILVRADQLLAVEEQWSIENGTHKQFLAEQHRRQTVIDRLRARFGREPSANDVEWAILNDDILTCAKDMDWAQYRNARFSMAVILAKEKRLPQSLDFLLEVCYLDLNGPADCSGMTDPQSLRDFPPFDPKMGDLAPGAIVRIHELLETLGQSVAQVEPRFLEIGNRLAQSLQLPLAPDKAWRKLKHALKT